MKLTNWISALIVGVMLLWSLGLRASEPVYPTRIPKKSAPIEQTEKNDNDAQSPVTTTAERAAVCQGVTCSGHGTCVVQRGEPVCSCSEGFLPDEVTGLHCIPASQRVVQRSQVAPSPAMPPAPAFSTLNVEAMAIRQAKQALRKRPDYLSLRRKRNFALFGMILGGTVASAGFLFLDDGSDKTMLAVMGAGAGVFTISLVSRIIASSKIRDLYRQELQKQERILQMRFAGAALMVTPDGRGAGLSAAVQF